MTLTDGNWIEETPLDIDITKGCAIAPHTCGRINSADDSGSEIKVFKVDPQVGITGEDIYYSLESPVELKEQL